MHPGKHMTYPPTLLALDHEIDDAAGKESHARANPANVEDAGDEYLLQAIDLAEVLIGEVIPTSPGRALGRSAAVPTKIRIGSGK
jgi:hypothetical protein